MKRSVTARDLMSSPVRRLTLKAPVRDAAAFLIRHGISGAPVEDEHGKWKGVFSMNDLTQAVAVRMGDPQGERTLEAREPIAGATSPMPDDLGSLQVGDLMTPWMLTVLPEAPLREVVHSLLSFRVHRVFVTHKQGEGLLGVITTVDVVRSLEEKERGSLLAAELRRHP